MFHRQEETAANSQIESRTEASSCVCGKATGSAVREDTGGQGGKRPVRETRRREKHAGKSQNRGGGGAAAGEGMEGSGPGEQGPVCIRQDGLSLPTAFSRRTHCWLP